MPISQFSDVDGTNPQRLRASLARRENSTLYEPYRWHIAEIVRDLTTPGIVVDVGSGNGQAVARLNHYRPTIGVEPSAHLTRDALTQGRPVIQGTGTQLPFPDNSVAAVLLERVLQHIPDTTTVLDECARILIPGGVIITADPNHPTARIHVPHLTDLSTRVSQWRAHHGTATPNTNQLTTTWAGIHQHPTHTVEFPCNTSNYTEARTLTNFPEWARLAHQDGHPITNNEIDTWEQHFVDAKHGHTDFTLEWAIHVTTISVGGN